MKLGLQQDPNLRHGLVARSQRVVDVDNQDSSQHARFATTSIVVDHKEAAHEPDLAEAQTLKLCVGQVPKMLTDDDLVSVFESSGCILNLMVILDWPVHCWRGDTVVDEVNGVWRNGGGADNEGAK